MKKQLIIAVTATAAAMLCYFVLRNKYRKPGNESEERTEPVQKLNPRKHHLTSAFANAKKHTMHAE